MRSPESKLTALVARVEANASERRELAQALVEWAMSARLEPGGLDSHVYEDLEFPGVFCVASSWESRLALDTHLSGERFGSLMGALELLARAPEVIVAEGVGQSGDGGLRMIRKLRDQARRAG